MKWISVFFLTCIFLCVTPLTEAKDPVKDVFDEADSLFDSGNWFAAAIAYERIFYYASDPDQRLQANLGKARSLKQDRRYAEAYRALERSLTLSHDDSLRFELFHELALCAYLMGETRETASMLMQMEYYFPGKQEDSRMRLLNSLVLMRGQDWTVLHTFLRKWIDAKPLAEDAKEGLYEELDNLLDENNRPVFREPQKARMWSSFVPGSGQLYAGDAGKGLLNAFSQLASLTAAVALGVNGCFIAGTIIGLGGFQSFYFGGIKQAGLLVEERNKSKQDAYEAALTRFVLRLADS